MDTKKRISLIYTVLDSDEGDRVDQIAARQFPEYSRGHIQRWIKEGNLLVNNHEIKSKQSLQIHDVISIDFWEEPKLKDLPEDL